MKAFFLIVLLAPMISWADGAEDTSRRWLVTVHGGYLFDAYDNDTWGGGFSHQTFDSSVFGADLFYSHFLANNYLQLFYGGGLESTRSLEELGDSKIETTALSFVGQSGLFYQPDKNLGFKMGFSLGIYLWAQTESRLKTPSLNVSVRSGSGVFGGRGPSPLVVARFWGVYEWHPQWGVFVRIEGRDVFATLSSSLGVSYGF